MHKPLFFLVCTLVGSSLLPAQDFLGNDLLFFQKKARLYQSWLESKGMGDALRVDLVRLQKNDMELEMFLSVRTADPDTAAGIWISLERAFTAHNPGQNLGDTLFRTFVRLMEIPPAQGNVQIYIPKPKKDGPGYDPCFYIWLWEEHGTVAREERINNCKAQPLEVVVRRPQVKLVGKNSRINIKSSENARQVFDKILAYARSRYEKTDCYDRFPRVEEGKRSDYQLTFTVSDLCREVLRDEQKSLWCHFVESWLGRDCNDMRRERLEFTINFIPTDDGYLLSGQLTGKFGSGVYRPRSSAYMDMEPDFEEDFLVPYVIGFQHDLRAYLEK